MRQGRLGGLTSRRLIIRGVEINGLDRGQAAQLWKWKRCRTICIIRGDAGHLMDCQRGR